MDCATTRVRAHRNSWRILPYLLLGFACATFRHRPRAQAQIVSRCLLLRGRLPSHIAPSRLAVARAEDARFPPLPAIVISLTRFTPGVTIPARSTLLYRSDGEDSPRSRCDHYRDSRRDRALHRAVCIAAAVGKSTRRGVCCSNPTADFSSPLHSAMVFDRGPRGRALGVELSPKLFGSRVIYAEQSASARDQYLARSC